MISADDLLRLMRELESDRVERTVSTDTAKLSEAVAAFANDLPDHRLPGYLLVGVDDRGRITGMNVTDRLLVDLGGLRSDGNIQPLPQISVQKFSFPEGDVAVVEVIPSDLPPVRYRGRIPVRIGPRAGYASEQEERSLTEKRIARARTFDALPCRGAELSSLALDLFQVTYLRHAVSEEVLAENHRDIRSQLASLRFYDLTHDCPTNAGILLFGKDQRAWLPGAYVQFVRFQGSSLASEVGVEHEFAGDLLTLLRELESLLEVQLSKSPQTVSPLREHSASDYPGAAIREMLLNAILHRSYDSTAPVRLYWFPNHVEIQSPGGLYGEASPENFPNQNSYRNPVLAEALKTLGYVNRFGRGVLRAQAELERNGNPPAEFHFDPGFVRVRLKART